MLFIIIMCFPQCCSPFTASWRRVGKGDIPLAGKHVGAWSVHVGACRHRYLRHPVSKGVAYTHSVICGVGLLAVLSEDSREYVQRVCMCINFASQPHLPLNISSFGKHFVLRRPVRIEPISLCKCGTVQVPDPRSFPRTWSTYF